VRSWEVLALAAVTECSVESSPEAVLEKDDDWDVDST